MAILLALILVLAVLFTVQNPDKASLDLLVVQLPEQRVALWVLVAFALGGLCGLAISSITLFRLKSQTLLLQRKLAKQDKALLKKHGVDFHSAANKS